MVMTDNQKTETENFPAFPVVAHQSVYNTGMSLRDYYAGMALQGMLSGLFSDKCLLAPYKSIADDAYAYADAMLSARLVQAAMEDK